MYILTISKSPKFTTFAISICWSINFRRLASNSSKSEAKKSERGIANKIQTHYQILGVNQSACKEEIKTAFYDLSKKFHPDLAVNNGLCPTKSLKKFLLLRDAFEILRNDKTKDAYDRTLLQPPKSQAKGAKKPNVSSVKMAKKADEKMAKRGDGKSVIAKKASNSGQPNDWKVVMGWSWSERDALRRNQAFSVHFHFLQKLRSQDS